MVWTLLKVFIKGNVRLCRLGCPAWGLLAWAPGGLGAADATAFRRPLGLGHLSLAAAPHSHSQLFLGLFCCVQLKNLFLTFSRGWRAREGRGGQEEVTAEKRFLVSAHETRPGPAAAKPSSLGRGDPGGVPGAVEPRGAASRFWNGFTRIFLDVSPRPTSLPCRSSV